MKNRRGLALGTVLAVMAALAVVLFVAVSASLSHLSFSRAAANSEHARNLADAAIAQAMDELVASDYTLGTSGAGEIVVTIPGLDDAEGRLSFADSGVFSGKQSTNNVAEDNQLVGGFARTVPGRTIHLVARGRVGTTVQWMECLYHRPPFPDGLIATGPVLARALQLSGIRREGAYTGGDPAAIPEEETIPGNLFGNSASGFTPTGPSVTVSQNSEITGSVGSVSSIDVDGSSQVDGEVVPGSEARPMPELDVLGKIALLEPNAIPINGSHGGDLTLDPDWFSVANGDLSVSGDLDLQGSALLVKGNLTVGRAVTGTGAILVDGDVQIGDGGTSVVTNDQLAIGCTGDFRLEASAPEDNYFKGLVYCEGDFQARDITVVGATVVNGKNGAAGSAQLENVRFVYSPGAVELELQPPKGKERDDHTLAVGFTIRPSDVEGEYVCDARAYFAYGRRAGDPTNIDHPKVWPSLDNSNGAISVPPPNPKWYQAFHDVPIGNPNAPNFGLALQAQIGEWAEDIENMRSSRPVDWNQAVSEVPEGSNFIQFLRDSINRSDHSQRLSFNLNNLFAESMGRSRVLYWKPVK